MRFMGRAAAIVALLDVAPAVAVAQTSAGAAPGTAAPESIPSAAPSSTATTGAPAEGSAPVVPATGYGWSDPKKPGTGASTVRASHHVKSDGPEATLPGFETLGDGSSRLFVELSKPVQYETKKAGNGTITYVLKRAHVTRRNNYNPLVTVHFNTPVANARLVPHGRDLWFVVSLRSPVQPTVALDSTKDGGSMLRIEFPKGNYLPATHAADSASADTNAGH
jgi:hypothetical protein